MTQGHILGCYRSGQVTVHRSYYYAVIWVRHQSVFRHRWNCYAYLGCCSVICIKTWLSVAFSPLAMLVVVLHCYLSCSTSRIAPRSLSNWSSWRRVSKPCVRFPRGLIWPFDENFLQSSYTLKGQYFSQFIIKFRFFTILKVRTLRTI